MGTQLEEEMYEYAGREGKKCCVDIMISINDNYKSGVEPSEVVSNLNLVKK